MVTQVKFQDSFGFFAHEFSPLIVLYISPRFMPGLFMSIFSFFNLYVIPQPRQSRAAAIYKADFSAKISVFSGVFMTLEYSLLAFLE